MDDQIGSGITAPEFIKQLNRQMKDTIVKEVTISRDSLFTPEEIKALGGRVALKQGCDGLIRSFVQHFQETNEQVTSKGLFFKSPAEHLSFIFQTTLDAHIELLQRSSNE